ncbi:MAG TPA: response regulator, partial [Kofleriaceae bacterium]|nr:response regulator [Kofleriaceae bacterium]
MNRRILLIDADPAFRTTLAQHLGRYQFVLDVEPDPDEAIAHGAMNAPATVMVAVEEPEKVGFKVFQRLKKGPLAKVPIVLVTSSVSPESFAKHRGLKVHADEYLDKRTLSQDELLGKLDNLIGLGDLAEDDLDIPVEVDDIALTDGDMVLDETVGEEEGGFGGGAGGAGSSGVLEQRLDSAVDAETEAAFEALLGGGDDLFGGGGGEGGGGGGEGGRGGGEGGRARAPSASGPVPAPIHDRGGPEPAEMFETMSRESRRPRARTAHEDRLEPADLSLRSADMIPLSDIGLSQPGIRLDPEDIQPVDDAAGIPEQVPYPMSLEDAPTKRAATEPPAAPTQRASTEPPVVPSKRASTEPPVIPSKRAASEPPAVPTKRASTEPPDVPSKRAASE